jgi:hypothetical protein
MNARFETASLPSGFLTVISIISPFFPGGVFTSSVEAETNLTRGAGVRPKRTVESATKFLPSMLTSVPPSTAPLFGAMDSMTGAGEAS